MFLSVPSETTLFYNDRGRKERREMHAFSSFLRVLGGSKNACPVPVSSSQKDSTESRVSASSAVDFVWFGLNFPVRFFSDEMKSELRRG
jgi:hypothetical protein